MSLTSTAVGPGVSRPAAGRSSGQLGDGLFRAAALGCALLVLALLMGVAISMLWGGLPAFRAFGLPFLYGTQWDPVAKVFTAGVAIYGTLVSSALAMLIAIPVSFGIAVFLTEVAPAWMRGSGRHRYRTARGRAVHHLRHVGPVHLRPRHVRLCRALAQ